MTSRVFTFGDGIDTDQLAPGQYMKGGIEALAAHCLESVRPGFASDVQHGDIIVAGSNFGLGSSREQAADALRHLGVRAVIAKSFAGIFYRNAINLGLPALTSDNIDSINDGDQVELDIANAKLVVTASGKALSLDAVPPNIQQLLDDGGLVAHLKKRFAHEKKQ